MAQLALIKGPTQGINQTFLSNVNAAADAAGIPVVQITPHGGKRSDAAHPGGPSNAGVGGVAHSNHLTGNAIDAYAVYPSSGRQVPLATALANSSIDPSVYGLRLGTSFDYGGTPDVMHVDDAANQQGGVLTASYADRKPTVSTPPAVKTIPSVGAGQIDAYLKRQGSPLYGLGKTFVQFGQQYGVDPGLLVAITGAESMFGRKLPGKFNPFSWNVHGGFPNFVDAIRTVAHGLSQSPYDLSSIALVGSHYAPVGAANDPTDLNKNWVPNVSSFYNAITGHPYGGSELSYPSGGGASAGAGGSGGGSSATDVPTIVPVKTPAVGTILVPGTKVLDPSNAPLVTPPAPPAPSPTKAAPTTPSYTSPIDQTLAKFVPLTTQQMQLNAANWAKATVGTQIAQFMSMMDYYRSLGQSQQSAMQAAGKAAADVLSPLGTQTGDYYTNAINALGSIGKGYTGQLASDVSDQTSQMNRDLAAANAPGRVSDQGANLGNVALGTSVSIPAQSLGAQGAAAVAKAQALAPAAQAYATQQGYGAVQAANNQALGLMPNIISAEASLPQLTTQYMQSQSQLQNQQIQNIVALAGLHKPILGGNWHTGFFLVDPATGAQTPIGGGGSAAGGAGFPVSVPLSRHNGYVTDQFNRPIRDAKGNVIPYTTPATGTGASPYTLYSGGNGTVLRLNRQTGQVIVAATGVGPNSTHTIRNSDGTSSIITTNSNGDVVHQTNIGTKKLVPNKTQTIRNSDGTSTIVTTDSGGNIIHQTTVGTPNAKVATSTYRSSDGRSWLLQTKPDGSYKIVEAPGSTKKVSTSAPPRVQIVGKNGGKVTYERQPNGDWKVARGLPISYPKSPSYTSTLAKAAQTMAKGFRFGLPGGRRFIPPQFDKLGRPIAGTNRWINDQNKAPTSPVTYQYAMNQLFGLGPATASWRNQVIRILNSFYAPGIGGRPYQGESISSIVSNARAAASILQNAVIPGQ